MHGHDIDALKLFERMKKVKVEPDEITFTSILTVCSHSGLVEEGQPEEAYDAVKCVPSRRSASALVALLAACRVHGNRKIGEKGENRMKLLE
ncbi:hypothetical protein JRO89_XS12G0218400 [Xanthoceras sorbifolium]|uniref:Pentatricopeptide repeat-containing protein n=1 Tax=Xanthoceras sorbifolium TaxID=99658 RepID=A0ABQ8HDB6_9ROSI|nr:hypothetical protein JRO89_XS12G0218400 [Xanthoceras sorbifolium]